MKRYWRERMEQCRRAVHERHSLRWRLTKALLLCIVLAFTCWKGYQSWQLTRERTGFWDASLREIATQILTSMPHNLAVLAPTAQPPRLREKSSASDQKMSFQIWAGGRNVVHSPAAPAEAMKPDFADGYATRVIGGETWRVYSVSDRERGIIVQVGRTQDMMAQEFKGWVRVAVIAALQIFVLFGLVAWVVIGRSLRPVTALRRTLMTRQPLDLTPLPVAPIPTELQPLVEAFNSQLARVDEALQNERRFIADAAHELRTPLAVLIAHADLALRANTVEEKNAALQRLSAGVQRSARLSEQLLDLARLDTAADGAQRTPVDLSELLVLLVRDFETLARERRQKIALNAEPAVVNGDIDQLGILLRNLLDNAVRYAGEGGTIAVSCGPALYEGAPGVMLQVADDGPGVPAADRDRIFDRFYRAPGNGGRGSGIGLSLVARAARGHDARIVVGEGIGGRGLSVMVFFRSAGEGAGAA
ncbi:ATP-binding protein [Luteimonas sp. SX5]|uniref:histidine kinase n=1 Tax=Luteimonas galliterrae TaxID=2940486 RepID=A0ABT0MM41_9GAMM|nr:ATP-binding protein [Luteimonas galliterrae]MCL1635951.1 ATP-binding protein [Luteimonas galliterrae]